MSERPRFDNGGRGGGGPRGYYRGGGGRNYNGGRPYNTNGHHHGSYPNAGRGRFSNHPADRYSNNDKPDWSNNNNQAPWRGGRGRGYPPHGDACGYATRPSIVTKRSQSPHPETTDANNNNKKPKLPPAAPAAEMDDNRFPKIDPITKEEFDKMPETAYRLLTFTKKKVYQEKILHQFYKNKQDDINNAICVTREEARTSKNIELAQEDGLDMDVVAKMIRAFPVSDIVAHFLVSRVDGMQDKCSCPCGNGAENWRKEFGLNNFVDSCKGKGCRFRGFALMQHLKTKAKNREGHAVIHHLMATFIGTLFQSYCVSVGHSYLYDPQSSNALLAVQKEREMSKGYVQVLQKKVQGLQSKTEEQAKKLQEQEKEIKTKESQLEQMKNQIEDQRKELLSRFKIHAPSAVKVTEQDRVNAFKIKRHMQRNMKVAWGFKKENCYLTFENISDNFQWINLFRDAQDRNDAMKLMFKRERLQQHHLKHFVGMPNILSATKGNKAPIDDGGPSRQFLSSFYNQLTTLRVGKKHLFETQEGHGYLVMKSDWQLLESAKKKNAQAKKDKMRDYFRAIGRFFLLTLVGDHGVGMPAHILSRLHWNYILLGKQPLDKSYSLCDLVVDFYDVVSPNKLEGDSNVVDAMKELLGKSPDECDDLELEKEFREAAQDVYIEQKKFTLEALREGMYPLGRFEGECPRDEETDWTDFFYHLNLVESAFFCHETISASDVIKILEPKDYDFWAEDQRRVLALDEDKNRVGILPDLLMMMEKEPEKLLLVEDDKERKNTLLSEFICFVTGYHYLPRRPDFKIHVELAVDFEGCKAQTCENKLKLPYTTESSGCRDDLFEALRLHLITSISGVGFNQK